jgi:hypothetical protein
LPELGRFDLFRKRARALQDLWYDAVDVERAGFAKQQIWLQRHDAMEPLLGSLGRDSAILQRKATRNQIVDALVQLDDLPAGKQSSPGAKSMLARRVGAQEPSLGGINFAVLDVADNERWFPAPAVVLEALSTAERFLDSVVHALSVLPRWHRLITVALAESEREQNLEHQRRAARIEHLRSLREPPA